ncbi:MAG: 4-hydroxy-tetrahydrodipicolinate synthase [Anaeroplasmataceae bacterium]
MIKGSIVALITPMNEDGSVNYEKLGELIEFHIENKTDGIVILGTTGEASTLEFEEEEKIIEYSIKKANKRIPIIVGSGSNSTKTAIDYTVKYGNMGADALLVITPYYNKTNESGMIKHFTAIADASPKPIIMYNVPGRTGCSISVHAVEILSKHPNIIGIKEASGDLTYAGKIAHCLNDEFVMYSGNDDIVLPLMSLGAVGVISVWSNIMPRTVHDMCYDFMNGNIERARQTQIKYLDLIHGLFLETNPIPVKKAMNYLGYNVGPLRMPLDEMSDSKFQVLKVSLDEMKGTL